MEKKIKRKMYPELPLEEQTPLVPNYNSLPQLPLKITEPVECPYSSYNPFNPSSQYSSSAPSSVPYDRPSFFPSTDKDAALPSPIHQHYKTFLLDYVAKIEDILEKFEEIKKRASEHHQKSNWSKVSGTVVSSTGVALVMGSLWWAPITLGNSLIMGAGGAVMSVTGSLTNAVTDYIDYKTTATIMNDIKLLLKEKELFDSWMRKSLSNFNECIEQLMKDGHTKEVAISTIIEGIAKGAINIMEKPNDKVLSTLSTAVKLHRIQHIAADTLPVIGKTFHMTEKSFQFIYNILGLTGRTIPTLIKDFAKISGVLSVAFAMADISILIKDLCSEHPSIDIIDKVIDQLQDEKSVLLNLLDILKAVEENSSDSIFEKAMLDIQMIVDKEELLKDFVIVNDEEFHERAGISVN